MKSSLGALPRRLAPGLDWLGDCYEFEFEGKVIHSYHSMFLVHGDEGSLVVDTGHAKDWATLERQLDSLMATGIAPVRWIFPTHSEAPHSANTGRLLVKFPDAVVWGDVRDYHLSFPEHAERFVAATVGDGLDLGRTRIILGEAVIRDLVTSLWAYDTSSRTLFPGDGFAYMHHHEAGQCGLAAEEMPDLEIAEFTAIFAEYALYWTRFTDLSPYVRAMDDLLASTDCPVEIVAPGHGSPILEPRMTVEKIKLGMSLGAGAHHG